MPEGQPSDSILDRSIRGRRWEYLQDRWLDTAPAIEPPGTQSADKLTEIPSLQEAIAELGTKAAPSAEVALGTVEPTVFQDAIQFLHRASNMLSAAEILVRRGAVSWSLSSAYHGGYAAASGVLGLLGLVVIRADAGDFLLNTMPVAPRTSRSAVEWAVPELWSLDRISHRGFWLMFQRALRVSRVDFWPDRTVRLLGQVDLTPISRLRNRLHYRARDWPLKDLTALHLVPGFGEIDWNSGPDRAELDSERKDFLLVFALVILRLGQLLLGDLGSSSPKFERELRLFTAGIDAERHPLVSEAWGPES